MPDKFDPWKMVQEQFSKQGKGWGDLFRNGGPWNGNIPGLGDMSSVDEYIRNAMNQAQAGMADMFPNNGSANSNVFETHDSMIARFKFPQTVNPREIRIFFDAHKLLIKGLQEGDAEITLPANGQHKGSTATIKGQVLEVHIPKKPEESWKEIDVTYIR